MGFLNSRDRQGFGQSGLNSDPVYVIFPKLGSDFGFYPFGSQVFVRSQSYVKKCIFEEKSITIFFSFPTQWGFVRTLILGEKYGFSGPKLVKEVVT